MRNLKDIKRFIFDGMLIVVIMGLTLAACNDKQPEDTKDVAEETNEQRMDNMDASNEMEKDADFLVDAAEINLAEIELGKLAQTKGTRSDVKELGKMMEDQHTKTFNELKDLAARKNITIPTTPTEENMDDYRKLSDKTGEDFDKEYADMMVKGHKDAIDKFEKFSTKAEDDEIKQWASATLPALRNHLGHAEACQEKAKNN